MSKVITFSRVFPKYHQRAGEPTYFVEQIYNALFSRNNLMDYPKGLEIDESILGIKKHTIRNGNRWKVGDKFSPRVWTDVPYQSKQITICPDIEVRKVYGFIIEDFRFYVVLPSGKWVNIGSTSAEMKLIATNDGLQLNDLHEWFQYPKDFSGQIICWSDSVNYCSRDSE